MTLLNVSDLAEDIDIEEIGDITSLSSMAKDITGLEETDLKRQTLMPLVYFYIGSNSIMAFGIFLGAIYVCDLTRDVVRSGSATG